MNLCMHIYISLYIFLIVKSYSIKKNKTEVGLIFRLRYKFYFMVKYDPAETYEGVENGWTPSLIEKFFKFSIEDL